MKVNPYTHKRKSTARPGTRAVLVDDVEKRSAGQIAVTQLCQMIHGCPASYTNIKSKQLIRLVNFHFFASIHFSASLHSHLSPLNRTVSVFTMVSWWSLDCWLARSWITATATLHAQRQRQSGGFKCSRRRHRRISMRSDDTEFCTWETIACNWSSM